MLNVTYAHIQNYCSWRDNLAGMQSSMYQNFALFFFRKGVESWRKRERSRRYIITYYSFWGDESINLLFLVNFPYISWKENQRFKELHGDKTTFWPNMDRKTSTWKIYVIIFYAQYYEDLMPSFGWKLSSACKY